MDYSKPPVATSIRTMSQRQPGCGWRAGAWRLAEVGDVVYLCKRLRTGLRLAQVEPDANGEITTHR